MNVLEQARELLRRERAQSSSTCLPPRTPKVTVVMHDQIFDAATSDVLPTTGCSQTLIGGSLVNQEQLTEQQAVEKRHKLFMDDVRRLGALAQLEYERQQLSASKPSDQTVAKL